MTNAVVARVRGDDYQARFFWFQVCRLFEEHSKVAKVAYELEGVKSFDDVVVFYHTPIVDERGQLISADYFQVKFHVDQAGSFTCDSLMDPSFIGATSFSLLERLRNALQGSAPGEVGCRFHIIAPWNIRPEDPLARLVSNSGGEIRLGVLFDGQGGRSVMGKIRSAWCSHLNLGDEEKLKRILLPLRINANSGNFATVDNYLNVRLAQAGLEPIKEGTLVNPYDDLVRKLHGLGLTEFTRADIEEICRREGLWRGRPASSERSTPIGIRSFTKWAENMEDITEAMLSLAHCFDNRQVKNAELWHQEIFPCIARFLSQTVSGHRSYHLYLDAHVSIAFAAGYCLDSKSGINIVPVQSTLSGKVIWSPDVGAANPASSLWMFDDVVIDPEKTDVAVAISATHPIIDDVKVYVRESLPSVGRILSFTVAPRPSPTSVRDGRHAFQLAQEIACALKENRGQNERAGLLHIFAAGPNALLFFLGRLARSFGAFTLYEYDFESNRVGAYQRSITLPIRAGS